MSRRFALIALLAVTCGTARAEIQKRGPELFPGKNEISLHIGTQAGLDTYTPGGLPVGGPPSGFRFTFDYGFRVNDVTTYSLWLDFGFSATFGGCNVYKDTVYSCAGDEIAPHAGVKLKFRTPIPLVPYAKIDGVFAGIFGRFCGDNGFGVLAHGAGGVKYFLTRNIGVGIETGITIGPAFYSGTPFNDPGCHQFYDYRGHTELYAAVDFDAGAEFVF